MQSIKLTCHEDKYLLVIIRDDGSVKEFVSCFYYNPSMPYGQQWDWGHYFTTLESALAYWDREVIGRPNYDRLSELATQFKDGLIEDGEEEAMIYFNETCEMTESEMEFFGIEESEDDDNED